MKHATANLAKMRRILDPVCAFYTSGLKRKCQCCLFFACQMTQTPLTHGPRHRVARDGTIGGMIGERTGVTIGEMTAGETRRALGGASAGGWHVFAGRNKGKYVISWSSNTTCKLAEVLILLLESKAEAGKLNRWERFQACLDLVKP